MGFLPDISRILQQIPSSSQNLMFSATFSPEIKKLAQNFLNDPVVVEVARQNATASTIEQKLFLVRQSEKTAAVTELIENQCQAGDKPLQAIVFVNAKITARRLARQLERDGIVADSIHGDKSQDERTKTLEKFKAGELQILVATDVAARGLDIPDLPVVINYDVPFNAEDYVHRIGRTGRAGSKGLAIMLMSGSDEKNVEAIERLTRQRFNRETMNPDTAPRYERRNRRIRGEGRSAAPYEVNVRKASDDPFFFEPYVPAPSSGKEVKKEAQKEEAPKTRARAVLLGGGFRSKH
jgi:superfamily II DNA/RNA helicase